MRALAMLNKVAIHEIPAEWKSIDAQWRDPRYLSRSAAADAGQKQLAAAPGLMGPMWAMSYWAFRPSR